MQKNSVKQMIQQLGEDDWFEIYKGNKEKPIAYGRDYNYNFVEYYNEKVKRVVIDYPNDQELQVIKLYIK